MKNLVITEQWLESQGACKEGKQWFLNQKSKSLKLVINKLIKANKFEWANWTVVRFMNQRQHVLYACVSAIKSLENFEKIYPNDKRPREAIQAALKWALKVGDRLCLWQNIDKDGNSPDFVVKLLEENKGDK